MGYAVNPQYRKDLRYGTQISDHARAQTVNGKTFTQKPFPSLISLDFTMA